LKSRAGASEFKRRAGASEFKSRAGASEFAQLGKVERHGMPPVIGGKKPCGRGWKDMSRVVHGLSQRAGAESGRMQKHKDHAQKSQSMGDRGMVSRSISSPP